MSVATLRTESFTRGARMLRTALGPAIARFLDDASVVEVMLNPDGKLWIDRLSGGLEDTGTRLSPADGERIVRLVAHHVGAEALAFTATSAKSDQVTIDRLTAEHGPAGFARAWLRERQLDWAVDLLPVPAPSTPQPKET